jgi:hypothetical protein
MAESSSVRHRAYVLHVLAAWGMLVLGAFSLNWMVDPLWYRGGNQLSDVNFAFNEREAKLNHLLRHPGDYDCLIFGSSRSTLLQADSVPGHRCFNLSFSGGQVEEFIAFAEYLKWAGMRPRLLIVGVDDFNLQQGQREPLSIPAHVTGKRLPQPAWKVYLTADSLVFTLRTLFDDSPLTRYYTSELECAIRDDAPHFHPQRSLQAEGRRRTERNPQAAPAYSLRNAVLYEKLHRIFPSARRVAYVPPVSAWHIAELDREGRLAGYLASMFAVSRHFPEFWDFSIPSGRTWRTDNTYDGSHYDVPTNRLIAETMFTRATAGFGTPVHGLQGMPAYAELYQRGLATFRTTVAAPRMANAQP